jgi:hypothetical protein
MKRHYHPSFQGWFSSALMTGLRRAGWKAIRRDAWTYDSLWQLPDGRVAHWSDLHDAAIILVASSLNPKGLAL